MHIAAVVLVFLTAQPIAWAESNRPGLTIYVDDDALSGGDGLTWQTAFHHLQDALHFAANAPPENGVTEIRVAQGVYKPDQGANVTPGDVNASFMLVNGIALRGSFAGAWSAIGKADPDLQDFQQFPTILSGDLLGNDRPNFANRGDNSENTLRALELETLTVIEAFVIQAGSGGVAQTPEPPFPIEFYGGGLFARASRLRLSDCAFVENQSQFGGGFAAKDCLDTLVERCTFTRNSALYGGGGMYALAGGPDVQINVSDSLFWRQNPPPFWFPSVQQAGGLYAKTVPGGVPPIIQNSDFMENFALYSFGGAFSDTFINCRFIGNTADYYGGVAASVLIGCELSNNVGIEAFGGGGAETAINSIFANNYTIGTGGGAVLTTAINCQFLNNHAGFSGEGNGGGLYGKHVVNSLFIGNSAGGAGSAIRAFAGATVTNCTIVDGLARSGIAVFGDGAIRNSILWNNGPIPISGSWDVQHSCVEGGWPGAGNISVDPQFVNVANGDFRLNPKSPCIDAGDNAALLPDEFDIDGDGNTKELLPTDLDGNSRQAPGAFGLLPPFAVDMGAFEFQWQPIIGDLNHDRIVNVDDLLILLRQWGACPSNAPCSADIAPPGGDGIIGWEDLLLLLRNWT